VRDTLPNPQLNISAAQDPKSGLVVGGTTVNITSQTYKAWAVITHYAQAGCKITGAISVSAVTQPTSWTFGPAGQMDIANEGLAQSPLTVAVSFNAANGGTAMIVANFQETCPGLVTPLHQSVTLAGR